jgi:2-(1,2-epoxy-1,2-dihydrophenyl)acetyl-CoA isomerase
MTEPLVQVTQAASIRTLTLNRPKALNSINSELQAELMRALDDAAGDSQTRCVILTGAGRAFCAGQDLSDPLVAPGDGPDAPPKNLGEVIESIYKPLVERLRSLPVPVIAAVNGVAAGAGANLALNCDIVIAARSACFIQAFARIGLVPDTGGTWLLPRLMGRARALGLALLGDKLNAEDAERFGLIWKSADDDQLPAEASGLAVRLAAMPVRAVVATRRAFDAAQHLTWGEALDEEGRLQTELGFADDYREGLAAFVAKRSPNFTDR